MNTRSKTVLLVALLVVAGLVLAACGEDDTIKQPMVRVYVGEQATDASADQYRYSYCWPQVAENVECEMNAAVLAEPAAITAVTSGSISFSVSGGDGTLDSVTATLLRSDMADQASMAVNRVLPLNEVEGRYYVADDLPGGVHVVQLDARYGDVKGRQAYVSYVFALDIGGALVVAEGDTGATPTEVVAPEQPTATPAEAIPTKPPLASPTATEAEPTATQAPPPTKPPLPTATEVPTEEPVDEPTEEPEATDESAPTAEVMALLGETDEPATMDETDEPAETVEPIEIEATATPEVMEVVPSATPRATNTPRPSATPRPSNTPRPSATPTTISTRATEVIPTQVVPSATPLPPLLVPSGTPTPGPVSVASLPEDVPSLTLVVASREYQPVGFEFCQRDDAGGQVCLKRPGDAASPARIQLDRGTNAQLVIEGARPRVVRIEYRTDTGLPTGQPEDRPGSSRVLFIVSPLEGTYIMVVHVTWEYQEATYFFRVEVV